jgi:hypothetical protein
MAKIMAKRATLTKTLATALAVGLALAIGATLVILFRKRSNEKFSAENFASAVVSQNPKVFERLAEM